MNLTQTQIAILQRLADKQEQAQDIDPAESEDCLYLSEQGAEPLSAHWLIAQLIVDGELRPFYSITAWGLEAISRGQKPFGLAQNRLVYHLSKRDKHNIRVLNELGIAQRVLARFYRLKPGSVNWLVNHTSY